MSRFNWSIVLSAALAWTCGCARSDAPAPPAGADSAHDHGHDHAHGEHGPHDGHLIELGSGKYHAELAHDDDAKSVTIYLLAEDAKTAAPIAEAFLVINAMVDGKPQRFELPAKPLEGEPEGQSSRFELADPALLAACEDSNAKARLSVTIDGRPYTPSIEIHHDHEHEKK